MSHNSQPRIDIARTYMVVHGMTKCSHSPPASSVRSPITKVVCHTLMLKLVVKYVGHTHTPISNAIVALGTPPTL